MAKKDAGNLGQTQSRDIAPLTLRADIETDKLDAESRTVPVRWTTGARVLRYGWDGRYYEELSLDPKHVRMGRLNGGAPLLDAHNGYELRAVIGVVEPNTAKLNGATGEAVVRFAKAEDDPEADKIYRKVKDKIIRNVSVGYRVYKMEKVESGADKIPVYRCVDWEPYEISPVPIGADDGAGFRAADKVEKNSCEIITRGAQQEREVMTEEEKAAAAAEQQRQQDAEKAAEQQRAQKEATDRATKAERERVQGIRLACRAAKLSDADADKFIGDGTGLDAARAAIFDKLAAQTDATRTDSALRVEVGDDARDKMVRGAGDWLIQRANLTDLMRKHDKDVKVEPGEFRGLTLVELARHFLEAAGVKTRGMDKMRMVGLALTQRGGITQSTSDFGVLLENVMHKVLLAAYTTTPDTWSRFCARGSVSDFRAHNRYRMGMFGRLDKVLESGEFQNKQIKDGEKELISAATYGNIINLTRQAIINDDMGAFNRLATLLGRAARLSIEVDVYALLALNGGLGPALNDGVTMFHANHGNIGVGAALSVDSFDADRVLMAQQKEPNGEEYLDLRPSVLVLPIGLGGSARVINDAQYDTSVSNKFQVPNKVRGLYRDIVDTPRLAGTRRYSFTDPSVEPCIEVAFLDGQSDPYMESRDGFTVDGVQWKVRLDYGVGGVGFRGGVTNAGA